MNVPYVTGVDFGTQSGRVHDCFGRGANDVMRRLKKIRETYRKNVV